MLKQTEMFTLPLTRAPWYILIKSFFLAIGGGYLPWSFTHAFKKIETTMRWNCMSKIASFSTHNGQTIILSIFYCVSNNKNFSQNISITLLQISLKLHEHRGCYWRKKLPWMIFEEQFSVPRYTAASKIGNSVISLLWQLRCHCNPHHDKFSSSSNTTMVAIFPKLCL